jgi:hypothetical protein
VKPAHVVILNEASQSLVDHVSNSHGHAYGRRVFGVKLRNTISRELFVIFGRPRYHGFMVKASRPHPVPSALPPSEAELEAWHALSREEQLARYREALQNSGRKRVIGTSMAIILTEARRRVAARREI